MPDIDPDRIERLERRFGKFNILGGSSIDVAGSISQGYAVNIKRGGPVSGENASTGPTGPTGPPTGDCPPDVSILCESVSASKSKCGFSHDGLIYLHREQVPDALPGIGIASAGQQCDANGNSCSPASPTCHAFSITVISEWFGGSPQNAIDEYDSDCNLVHIQDLHNFWRNRYGPWPCFDPGPFYTGNDICTSNVVPATNWTGTYFCVNAGGTVGTTNVYSDEYTTDLLISNTVDDLPPYDGSFSSGGCSASATLAEDESTYAVTRFQYKFTFSPVGNNFTLIWNEHTEFDGGGSSDNPRSTTVFAGQTETSVFECVEPSDNGVTTIAGVTCIPA